MMTMAATASWAVRAWIDRSRAPGGAMNSAPPRRGFFLPDAKLKRNAAPRQDALRSIPQGDPIKHQEILP